MLIESGMYLYGTKITERRSLEETRHVASIRESIY